MQQQNYIGFTNTVQTHCPWCGKVQVPLRELTPDFGWICPKCNHKYTCKIEAGKFFSKRYGKWVSWGNRYPSDGITGLRSSRWLIKYFRYFWRAHDVLCNRGEFDDCTPICNWQCSLIARDVLKAKGHSQFIAVVVMVVTLFGGGGRARQNGIFWLNKKAKKRYGIA